MASITIRWRTDNGKHGSIVCEAKLKTLGDEKNFIDRVRCHLDHAIWDMDLKLNRLPNGEGCIEAITEPAQQIGAIF